MNKRTLLAIERIITCINELSIITKNKSVEYFYDSFEINILFDILHEIELNLDKISIKIKEKYKNIDWDIIKKEKHYDEVFGESLNLGKAWILASTTLKDNLLNKLIALLEEETPNYYKELIKGRVRRFNADKKQIIIKRLVMY